MFATLAKRVLKQKQLIKMLIKLQNKPEHETMVTFINDIFNNSASGDSVYNEVYILLLSHLLFFIKSTPVLRT